MVPRGHGSGHVVRASLCRAIWNSSIADFVVRLGYHSGCLKIPICMAHIKWLKHSSPGIALWQLSRTRVLDRFFCWNCNNECSAPTAAPSKG